MAACKQGSWFTPPSFTCWPNDFGTHTHTHATSRQTQTRTDTHTHTHPSLCLVFICSWTVPVPFDLRRVARPSSVGLACGRSLSTALFYWGPDWTHYLGCPPSVNGRYWLFTVVLSLLLFAIRLPYGPFTDVTDSTKFQWLFLGFFFVYYLVPIGVEACVEGIGLVSILKYFEILRKMFVLIKKRMEKSHEHSQQLMFLFFSNWVPSEFDSLLHKIRRQSNSVEPNIRSLTLMFASFPSGPLNGSGWKKRREGLISGWLTGLWRLKTTEKKLRRNELNKKKILQQNGRPGAGVSHPWRGSPASLFFMFHFFLRAREQKKNVQVKH